MLSTVNNFTNQSANCTSYHWYNLQLPYKLMLNTWLWFWHNFSNSLWFCVQNIAIQLVSEDYDVPESRYEKVFLANTSEQPPISASSVEQLQSGLEDYVLKHGNNLSSKCNSCFTSWYIPNLKSPPCLSFRNLMCLFWSVVWLLSQR
jgi:hypothetical protein